MMADEATQAYAATQAGGPAATQLYPESDGQAAGAEGAAAPQDAPPKKKRGKPKDELAPPKPKNAYQRVTGDARARIKEQRPELATDLKGMAMALKEEWDKTPQDVKDKMQEEFEEQMKIWKPKWEEYKKTQHYKEFFEIKQTWVDARQRKKLVKKMNKDAPKRPKSGYMLFAGEIRERVQKEVFDAGGGMGDIGKKISEEWAALSDERKAELAAQSAAQKKVFDVDIAEYKKTEAWANFCSAKAKLESKQDQKRLIRTKLDAAPKRAPSAYAIYRSEVMPGVVEEHKGLSCGELGKKIAKMWEEVAAEKKEEYRAQAAKLKSTYDVDLTTFKKKVDYSDFLVQRQRVKAKENKLLNLRETPKRPMSAFAMFAAEHKNEVPAGKGEGKGRDALRKMYNEAEQSVKEELMQKEQDLRIKWAEDTRAFRESQKFLDFKKTEKKIKMEFMNEATKVLTLRFLSEAPKQPPKSPFAVFVSDKRKAAGEPEGVPKSKKERMEELVALKQEWAAADLGTKHRCELQKRERLAKWKEDCKEFMANDTWKEYIAECKKLKVPIQSILKEKKKVLRKLKNGMSILPLPTKPESYPTKPPTAIKMFFQDRLSEIKNKEDLPKLWAELDEDQKSKYQTEADEKQREYREQLKEFQASDEGKYYARQMMSISRRNRTAKAKDQFLANMPKKPETAFKKFALKTGKALRIKNPGVKGNDFRKLLMDKWQDLDPEEKQPMLDEEQAQKEAYEKSLDEFKASEDWMKFKRAIKPKAQGKGKGKGAAIPKPKRPEGLPQRPLDAFKTFCKEMAGSNKALRDLSTMFQELPDEDREARMREAQERTEEFQRKMEEFDKSKEGRKYTASVALYMKKKRLALAKEKFLKDEPKRPPSAFSLFVAEKKGDVARDNPDLKGIGPMQQKLSSMWSEMQDEEKQEWEQKEAEAKTEYEKALEEFRASSNFKRYQAIVTRLSGRPRAKGAGKGAAPPPPPKNLPKKPPSGFFLFLSEQKSTGNAGNLAKATEGWRNLGAEGQKRFVDEAAARTAQYEKDMKEFTKSADGKKYLRLKAAAEKKTRLMKAKTKFLGAADAPKEPKRPPGPYFLFVQETRSSLPSGKTNEVARQITEKWNALEPEEKKVFEDKADALKQQYEKDLAEYKNSANFKKYDQAIKNINKKRGAKPKAGLAGRGRGAVAGRGRGAAGRGRGRGAGPSKPADSDSDSDVMGSDEDNSSSSDSDSD